MISVLLRHKRIAYSGLFLIVAVGLLASVYDGLQRTWKRSQQKQSPDRIEYLASIDLRRQGILEVVRAYLDEPLDTGNGSVPTVEYGLYRPHSTVQDTDIRGYLDGKVKYAFNQGTAYHMRVGRRIGGPAEGAFELKRSLIRWQLPQLPQRAVPSNARMQLWIEGLSTNSPLAGGGLEDNPLHMYVHGLRADWSAGEGGVNRDSFSVAARGEASWTESRAGIDSWVSPGALAPQNRQAIGIGVIVNDDTPVEISGPLLEAFLVESLAGENGFSVLLKLSDQDESRWGTEIGILSSDFGARQDINAKTPRLHFDVTLPYRSARQRQYFLLEPGDEAVMPVAIHAGQEVLISPTIDHVSISTSEDRLAEPDLYVRGGIGNEDASADWERVVNPIIRQWDWSQVKVSLAPESVTLGDDFTLSIVETWINPGPREKQLPELVLISPSGEIHELLGVPSGVRYEMSFQPNEIGLWTYGWSFLPRPQSPSGSHQGEGLFYVATPDGDREAQALQEYAKYLIKSLDNKISTDRHDQYRINSFTRWAARYAERGLAEKQLSDRLIDQVRSSVNSTLFRIFE